MNKLKGIVFGFAFAFCAGSIVLAVPLTSHAATAVSRADVIEWRYKVENSKLYKRQYNYSKQVWVGDWIFVSNVIED